MKGQIRNIYPGGNTPYGFYSYYNHILPQRKAEKIFCIKGGPGTGKSTLMKNIGMHFAEKGEAVDFLWCSSDPESLDGILLKERAVAIVDGTSPHIVDPKNPGAVDEILNLGEFWNADELRKHRMEIVKCGEKLADIFSLTYGYLGIAGKQYSMMADIVDKMISEEKFYDIKRLFNMKINSILAVRRAESRMSRESAMGAEPLPGKESRYFAGAITPGGIKNGLPSLIENMEKIIIVNVPVGFRSQKIMESAAVRFTDAGFDIEMYYCPMDPEKKLEHIIVPEGRFAVISCNSYHKINSIEMSKKIMYVDVDFDEECDEDFKDIWKALADDSRSSINKALGLLEKAKTYHDELESYYIPSMDFEKLETLKDDIIEKITAGNG